MAKKFHVGDVIRAKSAGLYAITNEKTNVKVLTYVGNEIRVKVITGTHKGSTFIVQPGKFSLIRAKRFTLPQFVRAVVLDNSNYETELPLEKTVILDLKAKESIPGDVDTLVQVVGLTGKNYSYRFAIDPISKVAKEEVHG